MAGLNDSVLERANLPQCRKPAHASLIAALKVASRTERGSQGTPASFHSIVRVIGSLGLRALSP